jgi:ferredoxin--NADP+ reductase
MLYPTAAALKQAGNRLVIILGARTRELIVLENEMGRVSDRLVVSTDDGSYGEKGLVTEALRRMLQEGAAMDLVLAVGPIPMMKAVAETTRGPRIRTIVSLNPIMIDGTGMCGGCRVLVDGKSRFACVDGPEFDGHSVDFDLLMQRNSMYREAEQKSLADYRKQVQAESELVHA